MTWPATPSARSRWRAKVVLPAPSGPCSSIEALRSAFTAGKRSRRFSRRPSRRASAGFGFLESTNDRACAMGWNDRAGAVARAGPCARIFPDRGCGRGSRDSRAGSSGVVKQRLSRRYGLHARARIAPRPSRRTRSRHAARRHRAHGLPAALARRWLAGDRMAAPGRARARRGLALRTRSRLPQGHAHAAAAPGRRPGRDGRAVRASGLHRLGAGAGGRTGVAQRPGLARQAHADARPRRRLDVLPRRDLRRPGAAVERAFERSLRQLHGLHRHLSDAGDRRAVPARRAALHLVPDDRAQGADPARVPRCDRQPHLWLRRLPARVSLEPPCATGGARRLRRPSGPRRPDAARTLAVARGRLPEGDRGQRHPPHRLRALAAQPRRRARQPAARARRSGGDRGAPRRAEPKPSALVRRAHRLGARPGRAARGPVTAAAPPAPPARAGC